MPLLSIVIETYNATPESKVQLQHVLACSFCRSPRVVVRADEPGDAINEHEGRDAVWICCRMQ